MRDGKIGALDDDKKRNGEEDEIAHRFGGLFFEQDKTDVR